MKRFTLHIPLSAIIMFTLLGCIPGQENEGSPQTAQFWEQAAQHREQAAKSYEHTSEDYQLDAEKGRPARSQSEEPSNVVDQDTSYLEPQETAKERISLFQKAAYQENAAGNNFIKAGRNWDMAAKNWKLAAQEYANLGDSTKEQSALENSKFTRHHANIAFMHAAQSFSRAAEDFSEQQGDMPAQQLRAHEKAAENYEAIAGRGYVPKQ